MFQIKFESLLLISFTFVKSREEGKKKKDQRGQIHSNNKAESNAAFSKGYSSSLYIS